MIEAIMTSPSFEQIKHFFEIIKLAENLKKELRHSWLSNGRQESVAEHSWRLSLMALGVSHLFDKDQYDVAKAIKIAIIHDLVEAIATDIPLFETQDNVQMQDQKRKAEEEAILMIEKMAGEAWGQELKALWYEHEHQSSFEAKVVRCLDKLEAQIQHNEANISTWTQWEKDRVFSGKLEEVSDFHAVTKMLCVHVLKEAQQKLDNMNMINDI